MKNSVTWSSTIGQIFTPVLWLMARLSYFYKSALLFVAVVILLFICI